MTTKTQTVQITDVEIGDELYVNNWLKWQAVTEIKDTDITRTLHWHDDWVQKDLSARVKVRRP